MRPERTSEHHTESMKNLVPLPYRRVSVQPYSSEMTEEAIRTHLLGREAYRRTDYVVLESNGATAVTAGHDGRP